MAKLQSNAKEIVYTIDRFRGVNESADTAATMKRGEASYMRNYRITDGGALAVRPAINRLPFLNDGSEVIALWSGYYNGKEALVVLQSVIEALLIFSGGVFTPILFDGELSEKANVFFFADKLYILSGGEFYSVESATTDGETIYKAVRVEGYIPTVVIAASPNGDGTLYEQVNKLTAKRKAKYSSDGTSTKYYLPETGITEILSVYVDGKELTYRTDYTAVISGSLQNDEYVNRTYVLFTTPPEAGTNNIEVMYTLNTTRTFAFSVSAGTSRIYLPSAYKTTDIVTDIVSVAKENAAGGWDTLTYESDYTYNSGKTVVILSTAPSEQTNYYVSMEFEKDFREEVCSMTKAEIYNGAQDTRIFVYGDGSNVALYSGLDENGKGTAEYFPDLNEIEIGDANTPITSMIRHRNRLLAFKPNATYSIYYSATSLEDGVLIPAFYLNAINREIGNVNGVNAVSVENCVRTLCHKSVYEWRSTSSSGNITSDARNAEVVSEQVRETLKDFDFSKCIQLYNDFSNEYYCVFGSMALVNNMVADAWYIYDNLTEESDTINAAVVYGETVYLGTKGGHVLYFTNQMTQDYNPANSPRPITAEWHSQWLDFGKPHYLKYSPKLWISGISAVKNGDGNVTVNVETDSEADDEWSNVYFRRERGVPATLRNINKKAKFLYYKLKLKTEEKEEHAIITGAVIRANYTIPQRH